MRGHERSIRKEANIYTIRTAASSVQMMDCGTSQERDHCFKVIVVNATFRHFSKNGIPLRRQAWNNAVFSSMTVKITFHKTLGSKIIK